MLIPISCTRLIISWSAPEAEAPEAETSPGPLHVQGSESPYPQVRVEADPESEAGRSYYTAREELSALFTNENIEKRVLAALRAYTFKDWEMLKTIKLPVSKISTIPEVISP